MKDPYEKAFKDVANALMDQGNMILSLARRILPVKEYLDFVSEFSKKEGDQIHDQQHKEKVKWDA